jgi:hypothetical protein
MPSGNSASRSRSWTCAVAKSEIHAIGKCQRHIGEAEHRQIPMPGQSGGPVERAFDRQGRSVAPLLRWAGPGERDDGDLRVGRIGNASNREPAEAYTPATTTTSVKNSTAPRFAREKLTSVRTSLSGGAGPIRFVLNALPPSLRAAAPLPTTERKTGPAYERPAFRHSPRDPLRHFVALGRRARESKCAA